MSSGKVLPHSNAALFFFVEKIEQNLIFSLGTNWIAIYLIDHLIAWLMSVYVCSRKRAVGPNRMIRMRKIPRWRLMQNEPRKTSKLFPPRRPRPRRELRDRRPRFDDCTPPVNLWLRSVTESCFCFGGLGDERWRKRGGETGGCGRCGRRCSKGTRCFYAKFKKERDFFFILKLDYVKILIFNFLF